ncbi:hypothetical protein MY1884_008543 [Beauveria asiatica]
MSLLTAALTISADLPVAIAWIPTVNSVYEVATRLGRSRCISLSTTSRARIATRLEGASRYEYYVDGKWTSQRPGIDNRGVEVANSSAGGQGTYFYSPFWKK